MAERNIDPGGREGGGRLDEPQDDELSFRNGEPRSDQLQGGEAGTQSPQVEDISVPEVSVKEENTNAVPKEGEEVSLQQDEGNQQSQPDAQTPAIPTSRTITKEKVHAHFDDPKVTLDKEGKDVRSIHDGAQSSKKKKKQKKQNEESGMLQTDQETAAGGKSSEGPNKRTMKKKRNRENKKKRKELERAQHKSDDSSVEKNTGMEDDHSQGAKEWESYNTATSLEHLDKREQIVQSESMLHDTGLLHPDNGQSHKQGHSQPALVASRATITQSASMLTETSSLVILDDSDAQSNSKMHLEENGDSNTQKHLFDLTEQRHGSQGDVLCAGSGASASTTYAEKEKLQVVLHAFIDPDHWSRSYETLIVEVRSDLSWESNCAKVLLHRLEGDPAVKLEATLTLPSSKQFPFEYKYYVHCTSEKQDCYEYLSHPESGGNVNRYIKSTDQLLPGRREAHTFHHYDDFILPSPKSSVFRKWISRTGAMKSATALANAKSEELRHRSIQLHLDSMTPLLCNFLTGIESQGDQLINEIALACQQVNDHLVVANISEYKTGPAEFGRVDVQKLVYEWILKFTKTDKTIAQLSDYEVSGVAMIQTAGLVAIAIPETVRAEGSFSKLTSNVAGEVAKLLSYHSLPLNKISECQEAVCKRFSTRNCRDTIQSSLQRFILLLATRRNITMILDVLLVLSSWGGLRCGGSLDVSQYILKEHRFIMEQLKCAFQSVLGEKPTKNQLQWLTRSASSANILRHASFSECVLQVVPSQYWEPAASYIPLQILFKYLDEFLGQDKIEGPQTLNSLLQCICRILQEPNSDRMLEKDPKVTGTLVEHGWNITERVTRGHYKLHVKQSAVHFYLHVCGFVAAYEVDSCVSMLPYLVELVEGFIQRSFQHFGKTLQQSAKFGCGTKTHLELEFNIWTNLLTVAPQCPGHIGQNWCQACAKKLTERLSKIDLKLQLDALGFCKSQEAPEVLMKIMLDTAVNAFAKCPTFEQEKLIQEGTDWRIQEVFSTFVNRQYANPERITLQDLCTWTLWPCYFKLSSTCQQLTTSEAFLVASALLQTTVNTIYDESITVKEVQMITSAPHIQQNLEQLLEFQLGDKKLTEDTVKKLHSAKNRLATYERERNQLANLITRWHKHIEAKDHREWQDIQNQCQAHVECCPVADLQGLLWSNPASKELKKIISHFAILFDEAHTSDILLKLWDVVCPPVSSLSVLAVEIWPKFISKLGKVSADFATLGITCADAAELLHAKTAVEDLNLFRQALQKSGIFTMPCAFSPLKVQDKLLLFEDMMVVSEGAGKLLELKSFIGLTGDFDAVQSISRCAEVFSQRPLHSVDSDGSLRKVVNFLKNLCPRNRFSCLQACLYGLNKSTELVKWLRHEVQDVGQLQNFTNTALISHCEDGTTADLIKHLEVVGTKLAPFIYHFKSTAGINELIDCCKMNLDDLNGISQLLDTCRENLEVFKSIQKMLSSVENTTFSQIQDVTKDGEYIVMVPKGSIPSSISDLVMVVIHRDGHSQTVKTKYTLDDLKDLQSKLALIRGNISDRKIQHMAETFWQGLELTVRMADSLLELFLVGHVQYNSFHQCYFRLAKPGVLQVLERDVKVLEADLERWNVEVELLRNQCYELNYFSSRQLSLICQQLSADTNSVTQPWFSNLLTSITAAVKAPLILRAAKRVALDRERTDQRTMLGLHAQGSKQTDLEDTSPVKADFALESNSVQPLTVDDLDETAKDVFDYLSMTLEYSEVIVLQGIAKYGSNSDAVEKYCMQSGTLEISMSAKTTENQLEGTAKQSSLTEELPEHPLISIMVGQDFPVELIKEAIQSCGDDEDKVFNYCLSEEKNYASRQQEVNVSAVSSDLHPSLCLPVTSALPVCIQASSESIWKLSEVGQFLELISCYHQEEGDHDVQQQFLHSRAFSSMFDIGNPNLILVPRADLYRTILSVYSESAAHPLPTKEEVLLCHSGTTTEDIRLLWRRAMRDPEYKRIFCLVCEHNLTYKIAKEAVQSLRELSQGHKDYRIVIICCREDEASSLLVSDLRDYKRNTYPLREKEVIRHYLRQHFTEDPGIFCQDVACVGANADPESSCVRIVMSTRSGMGKSLYIQRLTNDLEKACSVNGGIHRIVTVHGPDVSIDMMVKVLSAVGDDARLPTILHLDVSEMVIDDIGPVLFSMLILRGLQDSEGNVWRCNLKNLSVVEVTIPEESTKTDRVSNSLDLLLLLPAAKCLTPLECLNSTLVTDTAVLVEMDSNQLCTNQYQRVFQYLSRYKQGKSVDSFTYSSRYSVTDDKEWIQLIHSMCKLPNPSWREICHFVQFLNVQLEACEHSVYCRKDLIEDQSMGVSGFKTFVVKFMIRMSMDFTVPSIKFETDSGSARQLDEPFENENINLEGYQIDDSRAWDSTYHPYIFFNRDWTCKEDVHYDSMTFVGFNFQQVGKSVQLLDLRNRIIEANIMNDGLYRWLRENKVDTRQNPDTLNKMDILKSLCRVMENSVLQDTLDFHTIDPDPSYALTYDNMLKMLAIQMRFRCNIPVVIIGETGCGKTRLVRYMCQLQARLKISPKSTHALPQTFFILKVHGGITEDDIISFLQKVQKYAKKNRKQNLETVVFFDEANTTDAIGIIKEVMCDRRMRGEQIHKDIKFIAACNPYRKHSDNMIERLESAGLGFRIQITETRQRLGDTPLRHLVYRVLDLPSSMRALVYDYGSLNSGAEGVYIRKIVENHVNVSVQEHMLMQNNLSDAITRILSWCQEYMRKRKDECSYVSLRDIERFMMVYRWFEGLNQELSEYMQWNERAPDACTMAIILSLAVCYQSRLINRDEFEKQVVKQFRPPFQLPDGIATFRRTIFSCQEAFLSNMVLGPNIARNAALRENVFMMAVCVELRIPLFVVGKPGSSKSLAKSIVAESMKGQNSKTEFLKKFKSVQLLTYQCSQLSTPESIIDVFNSAQKLQNSGRSQLQGVSLVVLDEVGLAEDSPTFPLKALHPLLEDGTDGSGMEGKIVPQQERVAFIGISNWALDPAKMNRGIMVMRGDPGIEELVYSARGICSTGRNDPVHMVLEPMLKKLAEGYLSIVLEQEGSRKEFFGLRDFYSLIKMLYWLIKTTGEPYQLSVEQLQHAILRNFGGSKQINPLQMFDACLMDRTQRLVKPGQCMDCSPLGLIQASLYSKDISWHGENRYLLFLTENDAALEIMQNYLFQSDVKPFVLFGSSFPRDKDYTQVCRNINQIKICMETGRTVVLLNLENLYESLYDLLNQYYTKFLGSRYVDLGLQSHRIKCRVDERFKLILIADMDKVYDKFPIPLINRLEKHIVTTSIILRPYQRQLLQEFLSWISQFSTVTSRSFKDKDAFIGYQSETAAAVVLHASQDVSKERNDLLSTCKELLIQMACPDALARLKDTALQNEAEEIWELYFKEQAHLCLRQLLHQQLHALPTKDAMGMLIQVTTHSLPLSPTHVKRLCSELNIDRQSLLHLYIEEMDTEADFTDRIRRHVSVVKEGDTYILVQCSSGHLNKDLISCARHKAIDELENFRGRQEWKDNYIALNRKVHVIFIVSLPKTPGGTTFAAFQGGRWLCVHLDDLRSPEATALTFMAAVKFPFSKLFTGLGGIALHKRLQGCLQAAIAQIPEVVTQERGHKTDVLKTMLKFVEDGKDAPVDANTFYSILVCKITPLIVELEQSQTAVLEKGWAVTEALDLHKLQEGGTFLNTLLNRIDGILTNILTYIIEFIDHHNNLALINDDRLHGLWLSMFQDDGICAFSYKSMYHNSEESERTSLVPKLGSVSVGGYNCKVPFSWIILQAVEAQWNHTDLKSGQHECLMSLCGKMEVQHIGTFLRDYPMETASHLELHLLYLKDFVASVLQSHNAEEAMVLETMLAHLSDQMVQSIEEVTLLQQLVSYHVAYHLNEVHFVQYRALGVIFQDLHCLVQDQLSHLFQGSAQAPSSTFSAEPLDVIAVQLLLGRIAPKPLTPQEKIDFWNFQNLRHTYIKNLRECQTTVDGILKKCPSNSIQTSLRVQWHGIRAVQLYIEHLILPLSANEQMNEEIIKGAFRLWSKLTRHGTTFNKKEQLENFIAIVRSVDDRVATLFGFRTTEDRQAAMQVTATSSSEASYGDFCKAVKMLFLEVVSILCFGQGSYEPPTPELIEVLMGQVFQSDQATQDLTPLEWEESDSSPIIRSVLLQLILMGSEMEVDIGKLTENFLTTCSQYVPGQSQPKLLYSLVIRCLEDTAYKAQSVAEDKNNIASSLEKMGNLLESAIQSYSRHNPVAPPTFKWLNDIAQLRMVLALSADYLCMYVADTPEKRAMNRRSQLMMDQFVHLLSVCLRKPQVQELSLYLAKQIARRHGMNMLKRQYRVHSFVLPLSLQQHQMQQRVPDLLALSGDGYSEIRGAIVQAIVDESDQSFKDALQHLPAECAICIPLAIFSKLTWPTQSTFKSPSSKLLESMSSSIQQCGFLNHDLTEVTLSLFGRQFGGGCKHMQPSQDMDARILTALVLHVVLAIFSKQRDPVLKPFVSILDSPATMVGKYLPTMPEDFLVQAMNVMDMGGQYRQRSDMRGRFYSCPNGHPYIITECTGPNQSWKCPECHQPIGAQNSQLAQGNRIMPLANRVEVGYVLGNARSRSHEAMPERKLSPISCAVMRFILHACFMWSACHHPQAVTRCISTTDVKDVATFFWEHLLMDMRVLRKALSSAEEEVAMYLHQVIAGIAIRRDPTAVDGSLASKQIRNNWEEHFCMHILDPMLQDPAAVIQNGLDVILQDAELDHDEVFLSVYEKTAMEPDMMQTLWTFRTRITVQGLAAALNTVPDVKHKHPLLHKFLQEEPLLRALQYLPNIVQLQKVLVACLNHKIDRSEAYTVPTREYFDGITNSAEERASLEKCVEGFKKAWELVKERLAYHRVHISAKDVQNVEDVSENLPVAYFLPCASGPGLCSLALTDFLLFQQNELIEHCAQSQSRFSGFSRKSIPLSQVQPFHMVCYEGEIDSVILTHCRYSLTFGKGQEVEYDFAALEKHIYDRFLVTKPEIDQSSQPLMVYSCDIIRQDIFQQLRDKIKPQVVLSPEEQQEVLTRLHNNLRHISDALNIVTIAIGFLASAGSLPEMPCTLKDYILKVLKIRKTEFCGNCTLQHILSLWETLALEKARMHSLNGKMVPFEGYSDARREWFNEMPTGVKEEFQSSLKRIPLDPLMRLLFLFVQVRLRTFESQNFQWSLRDCLQDYIAVCNDNNVQDLEESLNEFPEKILVEHAVHVWHITVKHQCDLMQNTSVRH